MASLDERIDNSFAALAPLEQQTMVEARDLVAGLADDVKGLWSGVEQHLHDAALASGSARYQIEQVLRNDQLPLEHRARTVREIAAKVPAAVDDRYEAARTAIADVLPSVLLSRSLPVVEDPQARNEAITELNMLTAGFSGAGLITRLNAIAGGSDRRLAALVSGSWGLARLGGDAAQHHAVKMVALLGAQRHGTPSERAHAAAYGRLTTVGLKALAMARARSARRLGGQVGV
jgi:hypothetical protein